jgi:CBS domain-containing protein
VTEPTEDALGSLHGRLNDFTAENQQLQTVPRDTLVADALTIMRQAGFSQLPVMHNDRLVGVFSYRSFARRLLELNLGAGLTF